MNTNDLATAIADKLLFISGINQRGTLLTPSTPTEQGGSYCRDEVIREIESVLKHWNFQNGR